MKKNVEYVLRLVFCLCACLPLAIMGTSAVGAAAVGAAAADAAAAGAAASVSLPSARDFAFTEPEFDTLRDVETIDNQAITALVQDARGLIWIGTQNGLVRYDGYRFRMFSHDPANPFSLAADSINSLGLAKDGRLWVGTISEGISVFDATSERFEHFRHNEKVPDSLGRGSISAMLDDGEGGMWIATEQGLDHQPAGAKGFVHFRHSTDARSLIDDNVRTLLLDKAGRLWVGSNAGLQRLSRDGKGFVTVVSDRNVRGLFQAQDGKLWVGTREHGAAWLVPNEGAASAVEQLHWLPLAQLSNPFVFSIVQVNKTELWLATFGGGIIVVAAADGQVLQTLRHDPAVPGSLALDELKPLLLDRAGWLWVGTWGGGLQRINTNNTMLRILRHSTKRPNGLSHPDIRSILELDDGRLLIGSNGNGIDIFDRQRGLVGGYRAGKAGGLPEVSINALAQTKDGSVWAGTRQLGVVRQLRGSSAWVSVPGLPDKSVNKLLAARDGSLWVGTSLGVAYWRPQQASKASQPGTQFETLVDGQGNPMQIDILALEEDGQGRIWIGSQSGLWVYEPEQKNLISIPVEADRPDGLVSEAVSGILFDSHARLWFSTDKGLERLISLDGKVAKFEHVSALLGLTGNPLGANLLEDRQGRIWTEIGVIDRITSDRSIKMRMTRLTPAEGMDLGASWLGSYTQTRDGLLLFGGLKGLAIIDPARFKVYDYKPPLIISELKINGKAVAPAGLAKPMMISSAQAQPAANANAEISLTLAPTQRNFSLEFAALDYSEPKKNRYQYRLQGYEKGWINTDSEHRSAAYGNLWPGTYTLQVRGSNRLGAWSEYELNIPIQILPAWWQTWWFGLLLLLGLSAFIAALVQTRTRYLRQRQYELEQLVDERTGDLRRKQVELVDANHELNHANEALNQSNLALNDANVGLALSVETLRQLGDIGREITANLDAEIVFRSLYLYVGGLLDAPAMTIYRINAASTTLDVVFAHDDNQAVPMRNIDLNSSTSNVARAARERRELLLHFDLQDSLTQMPDTRHMRTALFAPLIVDDRVLGVMSIQSIHPNAYGERERLIFRTLSSYGAIAFANATAMAALHQAQGQLVQQEKMASLGGMVAGIAHEINTPLGNTLVAISGVEGAWQTLQTAVADGSLTKAMLESSTLEGMEYTVLAMKTATRAAELIALFKTISVNAESDRPVEIELASHLQEVASLVHSQLSQIGCKLEVLVAAGLSIFAVPEALTETLSRVLVNVLNHAFTEGRTGTLRLGAQADDEGDEVVITISDDGHGIAAENLPKVFDPFFTTKSGLHGHVGLGLHVAYNHVTQRLKGKIQITSTLGEGTSVEIRLKKHSAVEQK